MKIEDVEDKDRDDCDQGPRALVPQHYGQKRWTFDQGIDSSSKDTCEVEVRMPDVISISSGRNKALGLEDGKRKATSALALYRPVPFDSGQVTAGTCWAGDKRVWLQADGPCSCSCSATIDSAVVSTRHGLVRNSRKSIQANTLSKQGPDMLSQTSTSYDFRH